MDGKDFQGYISEYGLPNDGSKELFVQPNAYDNHQQQHHHHHQGAGVHPISPTLGGYSTMPPPRLQHSPPFDMSGWSQGWAHDTTALLPSGSATDYDFSPILREQQFQYHQQQQPLLHHSEPYPPCQREQSPSLSGNHVSGPTNLQGREVGTAGSLQHVHHQSSQTQQGQTSVEPTMIVQSSGCSKVPSLESPTVSAADNYQSVPQHEESSRSFGQSDTSTIDESSGDGVFSLLINSNSNAQPSEMSDVQSGSIYVPSLDVFPGDYGFKVTFKNPDSAAYFFTPQTKVLCINKNVDFAAIFSFSERPRSEFNIRTLVCPKTSQDIQKVGIVKQCPTHFNKDKGSNHFLVCRSDKAVYGECHSHSIITVPLDTMAEYDFGGPTCVYSCACYSTCVVGKGANKPTLVIIFSLVDSNGSIVGQDIVNLRCCACPNRDSGRAKKRSSNTNAANPAKKRNKRGRPGSPLNPDPLPLTAATAASVVGSSPLPLLPPLSSLPTQLNRVQDAQPDEDGYYTFTWRVKDKAVFNMLTLMKEGHSRYTSGYT